MTASDNLYSKVMIIPERIHFILTGKLSYEFFKAELYEAGLARKSH